MLEYDGGYEIAAGAGNGDRGKHAQRVVAQDYLVGEYQRGERCVERGRNRRGDAAGNGNAAQVGQTQR